MLCEYDFDLKDKFSLYIAFLIWTDNRKTLEFVLSCSVLIAPQAIVFPIGPQQKDRRVVTDRYYSY